MCQVKRHVFFKNYIELKNVVLALYSTLDFGEFHKTVLDQ